VTARSSARGLARAAGVGTILCLLLLSPLDARAGTALQTQVSSNQAEVGEGIRVELSALSDDESPSNPKLRVPPGFNVQGPSISSSQQISFNNGHFEHRRGITAQWIVVATNPGHFVIGPATAEVAGKVVQGQSVTVDIVPAGTAPRPQQRRNPFDPRNFDPFGMFQQLPGFPNLDDLGPASNAPPEAPPDYRVEHAPSPMAFLRATVTPTSAVVGQQVTLRIYAYGERGPYDEVAAGEASRPDFLSESIIDSSFRQPLYMVDIDGQRWTAVKLREIALFPLHAGTLTIGSMHMGFRGPRYPETDPGRGLTRRSEELHVEVSEPPLAGRPPGYELGDVGKYTISAEVDPRRIQAGDAIAVTIRLEGTGNVPHHVKHTDQHGVEWLDPTVTEGISPNNGVIGGFRSFRYVVRFDEPGQYDLGEVSLPFFDPDTSSYEVARARLGTVEVAHGPAATALPAKPPEKAAHQDVFEGLGGPRAKLEPIPAERGHLTDSKAYWALLAGGPMSVLALGGIAEALRRARRRQAEHAESNVALARRALEDARAAAERKERPLVANAIERALYAAIEDRFEVRARAVLRPDLAATLERSGAERPLADDIVALLDACDALRFAGDTAPSEVVERAEAAVKRIGQSRRGKAA
jgi:hypothetical protein